MKRPRISISGLMAAVLIVALDFGIGKALTQPPLFSMPRTELLILGSFPMANILAIGFAVLLASRRDPGPRRNALVGFEVTGLVAWLIFLAFSLLKTNAIYDSIRGLMMASKLRPGFGLASLAALAFSLPQLAPAFLGCWFGRRHAVRSRFAIGRIGESGSEVNLSSVSR